MQYLYKISYQLSVLYLVIPLGDALSSPKKDAINFQKLLKNKIYFFFCYYNQHKSVILQKIFLMIKIRLSHNKGYKWFNMNNIFVKGYVLTTDNRLLREAELVNYFSSAQTHNEFKNKLQQANGLYSVIIKKDNTVWAAVDNVRAFPLFYYQKDDFFAITDNPDELLADNINLSIDEKNAIIYRYSGFVTGNKTLLKDIFQIIAGEMIFFENNIIRNEFHTQFLTDNLFTISREELKEKLKEVVDVMGKNLVKALSGRPAIIPLSGGFDSRLIAYMLKKNNYKNVLCYTYGAAGNPEINNARLTAENLGYEWIFVEYNEFYDYKMNQDPLFKEYTHFSACYSSLIAEQDYFALKKLFSLNKIPENAVFIPGHSGAIAGDAVVSQMADPSFSYQNFAFEKTFSLVYPNKYDYMILKNEIDFLNDKELKKKFKPYLLYENWRFQEIVSKGVHNGAKIWDFFGYEYVLPLWDLNLFNFFVKTPLSHKFNRNLYKETLAELFEEYKIYFEKDELYPSENLIRRVAFRSKLKQKFPILKLFVNIWKTDRTGAKYFFKCFIKELKKAGCYRKMLNINGILSA